MKQELVCLAYPERGIYVYLKTVDEENETELKLLEVFLLQDFYSHILRLADRLNINTILIDNTPFGEGIVKTLNLINEDEKKEIRAYDK